MQNAASLNRAISSTDAMFSGNRDHYFSCGQSALTVIREGLAAADMPEPFRILDFGAGAGRVTRWLQQSFPRSELHACDVRQCDVDFLKTWNVTVSVVPPSTSALTLSGSYDLIWVGSVVTHLPEPDTTQLIDKLMAACSGLLVLSSHGHHAFERQSKWPYIGEAEWAVIKDGFKRRGYGYADYPGQPGYGISVINPAWLCERFRSHRIVLFKERAWDGHHDVIAASPMARPRCRSPQN